MNILITLNYDFLKTNTKLVIEKLLKYDNNKSVNGFVYEVNEINKENEKIILELASLVKSYSLNLKLKGLPLDRSMITHKYALDVYSKASTILGKNIQIIYSPSIGKYTNNLKEIYKYIQDNNLNINISLKNVEYSSNINKENYLIFFNDMPNLNISYDLGYEALKNDTYTIESDIINKVNNIYIYDNNKISTRCSFIHGNIDLYEIFDLLKSINFAGDIIVDIKEKYLDGEILDDKIKSYIIETKKVQFIKKQFIKEVN